MISTKSISLGFCEPLWAYLELFRVNRYWNLTFFLNKTIRFCNLVNRQVQLDYFAHTLLVTPSPHPPRRKTSNPRQSADAISHVQCCCIEWIFHGFPFPVPAEYCIGPSRSSMNIVVRSIESRIANPSMAVATAVVSSLTYQQHCIPSSLGTVQPETDDDDRVESISSSSSSSTWRRRRLRMEVLSSSAQTQRCHVAVAGFEHGSSYHDLFFIYISLFFFPWFYLDFSCSNACYARLAWFSMYAVIVDVALLQSLERRSTLFH